LQDLNAFVEFGLDCVFAMAGAAPTWTRRLAIQLVRGLPGTRIVHRGTVRALGLRRRHQTVFRENTPSICGMINQVLRFLTGFCMERILFGQARLPNPFLFGFGTHPEAISFA